MARPCPGCTGQDCTTIPCRIKKRLWDVLVSWEGTPYMDGQSCRGAACDCLGFVVGVFDELYQIDAPKPKRLARDLGVHNPRAAAAAVLELLHRYPFEKESDGTPRRIGFHERLPGDVVVVRSGHGEREGDGHAMIIGLRPRTAWHASHKGSHVCETGISKVREALAIYRPAETERWLEADHG